MVEVLVKLTKSNYPQKCIPWVATITLVTRAQEKNIGNDILNAPCSCIKIFIRTRNFSKFKIGFTVFPQLNFSTHLLSVYFKRNLRHLENHKIVRITASVHKIFIMRVSAFNSLLKFVRSFKNMCNPYNMKILWSNLWRHLRH